MAVTTHQGGCHCGAVRFRVDLDASQPATSCNCSMCGRSGTLLSFVPANQFTLEQGEDHLTDYLFNKHAIHHLFCKTCGIKSFARGSSPKGEMVAINMRCLDGIDVGEIPTRAFDGKSV
jgi:hypothetical protein